VWHTVRKARQLSPVPIIRELREGFPHPQRCSGAKMFVLLFRCRLLGRRQGMPENGCSGVSQACRVWVGGGGRPPLFG
jgi:hypothetical protein